MFVCICKNITMKDLEETASKHAFDSTAIFQELGLGSDCGICLQTAIDTLSHNLKNNHEASKELKNS